MALQQLADRRRLSHAYILSAPHSEERGRMARQLASAALCSGEGSYPCGKCRNCRKVEQGIHPDVITVGPHVDDKGREKKEIVVDQVRELVAESHVLPIEAERRIYIIEQADKMNAAAQNAALKLLEEPPSRLIMALCVSNSAGLLPTVRSRCVELIGEYQHEDGDAESQKLAREYLKRVAGGSAWELCAFCMEHEDMDTASARLFVQNLEKLAVDMLAKREDSFGLSAQKLMRLCRLSQRCGDYLNVNSGVKHIFGLLAVAPIADER